MQCNGAVTIYMHVQCDDIVITYVLMCSMVVQLLFIIYKFSSMVLLLYMTICKFNGVVIYSHVMVQLLHIYTTIIK